MISVIIRWKGSSRMKDKNREQEVRSPLLPLSCSVMYFANAAAVSTINVTKPHMYQPNIKVMFNRVN